MNSPTLHVGTLNVDNASDNGAFVRFQDSLGLAELLVFLYSLYCSKHLLDLGLGRIYRRLLDEILNNHGLAETTLYSLLEGIGSSLTEILRFDVILHPLEDFAEQRELTFNVVESIEAG